MIFNHVNPCLVRVRKQYLGFPLHVVVQVTFCCFIALVTLHSVKMAFQMPYKRRRNSSIVTPVVGHRGSFRSSSGARSSPVPHAQPVIHPQRQPKKRVSLLPPSSRESSVASYSRNGSVAPTAHSAHNLPPDTGVLAELDDEIVEREDNDSLNEVIMAVDLKDRGTVGCCYYIAKEEKLCLMEDVKSGGIEIVDTRKLR